MLKQKRSRPNGVKIFLDIRKFFVVFFLLSLFGCTESLSKNNREPKSKEKKFQITSNSIPDYGVFKCSDGSKVILSKRLEEINSYGDSIFQMSILINGKQIDYLTFVVKSNSLFKLNENNNYLLIRDFNKKEKLHSENRLSKLKNIQLVDDSSSTTESIVFKLVPNEVFIMHDSRIYKNFRLKFHPIEYLKFNKNGKLNAIKITSNLGCWYIRK